MIVAFIVALTETNNFRFSSSSGAVRWEITAVVATMVAMSLAWRQRRARLPASALFIAALLPAYFHNCCGLYVDSNSPFQTVMRFPPKPVWVDPAHGYLTVLAAAAVLVSLWRHKHDPNAAF